MSDNYFKTMLYASKVESEFRKNEQLDLQQTKFDYHQFLETFKAISANPAAVSPPLDLTVLTKSNPTVESLDQQIATAEIKAALSGNFNPDDLLPQKMSARDKRTIFSAIAKNCVVTTVAGLKWQMKRSKRLEVLSSLIAANNLKLVADLPKTDMFGELLRKLVSEGDAMDTASMSQEHIIVLTNVLETVEALDMPKPHLEDVRSKIKQPGVLSEYLDFSKNFVGREKELKQLRDFVLLQKKEPVKSRWQGKLLTGLGGVGKSALLSKFLTDIISQQSATVAVLDFDRPGINGADTFWLTQEITRQVGEQYAASNQKLTILRRQLREDISLLGLEQTSTSEIGEERRAVDHLLSQLHFELSKDGNNEIPLLLVFDTAEEIQSEQLDGLLKWIHQLADILHSLSIRIIFSGRLFEEPKTKLLGISQIDSKELCISEFDKDIAKAFLTKIGLSKIMTDKIINSELFPLRPLELKLVTKLLKEGSVTFPTLVRELKQNNLNKKNSSELFTGVIYRRVLKRISDKKIRDIAYPGLILRYVTPELIREVLQPVLKLKPISVEESVEILKTLKKYSWLAYEGHNGELWHRKDLRRTMLKIMIANEPVKTEAIRKKAIAFFNSGKTAESRAETIYHRLMEVQDPEQGGDLNLKELKNAYQSLSPDLADLSDAARILLLYASGKKISDSDIYRLPKIYFRKEYHEAGKRLVAKRNFADAYLLYTRGKKAGIAPPEWKIPELSDNWQAETLFCLGKWGELLKIKPQIIPGEGNPLVALTNYLFPTALVNCRKLDGTIALTMLKKVSRNRGGFATGLVKSDRNVILSRLSACLVMMDHQRMITPRFRYLLAECLRQLADGNPNLIGKKSLLLIQLVATRKTAADFTPGISLLRLDMHWLQDFGIMLNGKFDGLLKHVIKLLDGSKPECTSRQFLADLYGDLKTEKMSHSIQLKLAKLNRMQVYNLLKGPDLVYRDTCQQVGQKLLTSKKNIAAVSATIRQLSPVRLTDAEKAVFETSVKDNPNTVLESFVEVLDRAWLLEDFLVRLVQIKKNTESMLVLNSLRTWHKAIQDLVAASFRS